MKSREKIFAFLILGIFILSLITDWYRGLVLVTFVLLVFIVLDKMGRGLVLRELVALHICFICLLMPLVGYLYYTQNHQLSRIWVKYMLVPEEMYFGFAVPATTGFITTLCWPLTGKKVQDQGAQLKKLLERARGILRYIPSMGIYLMVLGILSLNFSSMLPVIIQFAFYLFFFAAFSGLLYVYYAPQFKKKVLVLTLFSIVIFANALQSGMFTIIAYMGITMGSFFFIGKKIAFYKKISVFVFGLFLVFLLQSVKHGYRVKTWSGTYEGNKATLFFSLIKEQFSDRKEEKLVDVFFPLYVRGNQGFNISMVMRRIPQQQDFDGGKRLFTSLASSLVPRVFWQDKPEAGGKFNMLYYAGYEIEGWSTNVSPLGEAYGSFGVKGGIVYMVLLGALIRFLYYTVFRIGYKIPLLIFWIPVIFYQITYSAEADTLQITNSLAKSAFFIWMLYRIWPKMFGVIKNAFNASKKTRQEIQRDFAKE